MDAEERIREIARAVAVVLRTDVLRTNPQAISAASEMIARDVGRSNPTAALMVVTELCTRADTYLPFDTYNRQDVEETLDRLKNAVGERLASDRANRGRA